MTKANSLHNNPAYPETRRLMEMMVNTSQKPGEGNTTFVSTVGDYLSDQGLAVNTVQDPELPDRSLLTVDFGDPKGGQVLAAISHSDVVGIENQTWKHDPWSLTEIGDTWYGRGVCDTHGSGVAMLLAGNMDEVEKVLKDANKRVTVLFTYDEEATSPELSMRGARLAVGDLGVKSVVDSRYFIAGEPTEIDGQIRAMRSHKGRWLAHFTVTVDHAGHVSDNVQNALHSAVQIISRLDNYGHMLQLGSAEDVEASPYNPPYSTVQVSAGEIKSGDFSTTPDTVRFTVDMRTLHDAPHEWRAREVADLIRTTIQDPGVHIELDVVKDALGSVTDKDSPIVRLAEDLTGGPTRGFNGGDEGRIMRLKGGMEGVTMGPGSLQFAHMTNEEIKVPSIWNAAKIYGEIFKQATKL